MIQEEINMPKVNPKDKDKHTSSSSLLTLTIETESHNPGWNRKNEWLAHGREKQLSCHRVEVGHSLTIAHTTTNSVTISAVDTTACCQCCCGCPYFSLQLVIVGILFIIPIIVFH